MQHSPVTIVSAAPAGPGRGRRRLLLGVAALVLAGLAACGSGPGPPLRPRPTVDPSFRSDVPPPLDSGRLPRTATPRRCAVHLNIDPAKNRLAGEVYIDVALDRPTSAVVLHGSGLTIFQAEIIGSTGAIRAETSFRRAVGSSREAEELVLVPLRKVPAGAAVLHLRYSAPLSKTMGGIYRVQERGERYVFTQFEPADARRMLPSFDEPGYKIPYSVRVQVPKGNLVVANGRLRRRVVSDDGAHETFTFATTPPLPSYLLALAVGPFEVRQGSADPVPLRVITPKGRSRLGGYALETAQAMLGILSDFFERPYPYDKLDLVAVPHFGPGATENAGLVTFREDLLLLDPDASSPRARRQLAMVMAHELAHQWFGNLVTVQSWDDLWLNEGVATYLEGWAVDQWKPSMEAGLEILSATGKVMDLDALQSARAVRQPVAHGRQAQLALDGVTYLKSASLVGMLHSWLGDDDFRRGLRSFLQAHEWGNASANDLLAVLSKAASQDVSAVASTFLDRVGVPMVHAELECPQGGPPRVALRQKRYRAQPAAEGASPEPPWHIPVCVEFPAVGRRATERSCTLLSAESDTLELPARRCPSWINPNADYRGYYRFSLPDAQLASLGRAVRDGEPRAIIGFLSNAWALARAGELPADQLLDQLVALKRQRHRQVVEQVITVLQQVSDSLVDDQSRGGFQSFAGAILLPTAKRLGWQRRPGDSEDDELLRRSVLRAVAVLTDDRWLVRGARRRAKTYLGDPSSLSPGVGAVALAVAARQGELTIEELLAALDRAKRPRHRVAIMAGLGSFRQDEQARRAYDLIVSDRIRKQDSRAIVRAAVAWPDTRLLFVRWLQDKLPEVIERFPGFVAARMVAAVGRLCDRAARDAAAEAFTPLIEQLGRGRHRLAEALESAELCIALRERQAGVVGAYLRQRRW